MSYVYVLDRYTAKYYKLSDISQETKESLTHKDFVVFEYTERGKKKTSIGKNLWYPVETDRDGVFLRKLDGKEKETFDTKQARALEQFPIFKKDFKASFEWSKPVTARYQIFTHQTYFYFYSEQRYVFGDFVRNFQSKIGTAIFFFQVWSRDMVRLSHVTDQYLDTSGRPLHYSYSRPLPSVEIDDIVMQWLEWRDVERLKDRSGRLKCSMIYEKETYQTELKRFPAKWQSVKVVGPDGEYMDATCYSININTDQVFVKRVDGVGMRLMVEEIKRTPETRTSSKKRHSHRRKNYWQKGTKKA